jgi:hypothetical protein
MSEKILRPMRRPPGNIPSVSHNSAVRTEEPAAAAAPTDDLRNKKRIMKASLIKLGAMCVSPGIALVFMTRHMPIKQMTA